MRQMSPEELATISERVIADSDAHDHNCAIVLMYESDPAAPGVVAFFVPFEAMDQARYEAKLRTILNPAEYEVPDVDLDLEPDQIPGGDALGELLARAVDVLRARLDTRCIYMTDPDCSDLLASARGARFPARLGWLAKRLAAEVAVDDMPLPEPTE